MLRILAQPIGRARDDLVCRALAEWAILLRLNWPEAGIINIEAAIEAGGKTVSGVQQDGAHKGGGAIATGVKQVWDIRKISREQGAEFACMVRLRVGTRENGGVRSDGKRSLRICVFEYNALFGKDVKMGRHSMVRV